MLWGSFPSKKLEFYETLCVVISLDWFEEQHNTKDSTCNSLKVYSSFWMYIERLIKSICLDNDRCGISYIACTMLQVLWWIGMIPSET